MMGLMLDVSYVSYVIILFGYICCFRILTMSRLDTNLSFVLQFPPGCNFTLSTPVLFDSSFLSTIFMNLSIYFYLILVNSCLVYSGGISLVLSLLDYTIANHDGISG